MPKKEAPEQAQPEVVARGAADVALKLSQGSVTRDALIDPQPGDIIPDNEEKGYHVGTERQPAEPVLDAAGAVRFESTEEAGPSKFETAREQKDRSNAREAGNPDLYGGVLHTPITVRSSEITGVPGGEQRLAARGIKVEDDSAKSEG